MISLTSKSKVPPIYVVTLPSYCMPFGESKDLAAKREAQLRWMRENGLNYLGDPQRLARHVPQPRRRAVLSPVRLIRHNAAPPAAGGSTETDEAVGA
jgi:hypothetical protein